LEPSLWLPYTGENPLELSYSFSGQCFCKRRVFIAHWFQPIIYHLM